MGAPDRGSTRRRGRARRRERAARLQSSVGRGICSSEGQPMTEVVLGLDQGTSSTRCLALDRRLECRGMATGPVASSYPSAGLVEQEPVELVASARAAIDGALAHAQVSAAEVVGLGIAN